MVRPAEAVVLTLELRPISLRAARRFVAEHHRHNQPTRGWLFGTAIYVDDELVGVGIAGRPLAQALQDGRTVEILRVCTIGNRNAATRLYGALNRAAAAVGYVRSITYTLASEPGTSVRAAGYGDPTPVDSDRSWASRGRARYDADLWGQATRPDDARIRWTRYLRTT